MAVPVAVSQFRLRSVQRGSTQEDTSPESRRELQLKRLKAMDNLKQTSNTCWNVVLSWLFLVYPSMALASMEAFSCQRIGTEWYLSADLQERCPSSSDGVFWFSCFTTAVWAVGTPAFITWNMILLDVRGLVDRKIRQAVVNQMIVRYQAEAVDPGQHKLANSIGKRVTKLGDYTADQECEHRSADLYQTIFPDHVACEDACDGHVFPELCVTIFQRVLLFRQASGLTWINIGDSKPPEGRDLDHSMLSRALTQKSTFTPREWDSLSIKDLRMNHVVKSEGGSFYKPADLVVGTTLTLTHFKSAVRKWFEDIDINLNSHLDRKELRLEFQQLGLSETEADAVLCQFDFDGNGQLDAWEFETGILHILDNCIPGLQLTDILVLFSSLPEVASNKPISLERFRQYLKDCCRDALVFTGVERAESLTGQQLLALLTHDWKRYHMDIGDDGADMQIEAEMDVVGDKTGAALEHIKTARSGVKRLEATATKEEEEMLRQVKDLCKDTISVDVQNATVSDLPKLCDEVIGALNPLIPGSFTEASANSDTSFIFNLRHRVMKIKNTFIGLLLARVQQLGLDLMDEGVITISPLEWDGALGPSEDLVIERFGFLLDAYQVKVWYWEVRPSLLSHFLLEGPDESILASSILLNFATPTPHC